MTKSLSIISACYNRKNAEIGLFTGSSKLIQIIFIWKRCWQ